jgi:hypothetical protein
VTLIISVVSESYVFQVSDRRVTLLHADGRRETKEEPLTKAVVFCDRAVFGFTGYAQLDLKRTDLWIAEQLKDVDNLGDGFDRMRSRLTEVFRRPQYRHGHTITAAGFKLNGDGTSTPYYALVTNHFRGGQWLDKPAPEFHWLYELAPEGHVGVFAAPDWLSEQRLAQLRLDVGNADSLISAVEFVVTAVREVAAAHAEVGSDLQLSVLPKASVGRRAVFLLTGGPPGETPTFHYLPVDADPIQYGPTFVCGGTIMSGMTVAPIRENDEERALREQETREFHRARRPQRAYVVSVRTQLDPVTGRSSRAPDIGVSGVSATNMYHPTEEVALVLTPAALDGFPELKTLEEIQRLHSEWGGGFDVANVSEVTGIGWRDL